MTQPPDQTLRDGATTPPLSQRVRAVRERMHRDHLREQGRRAEALAALLLDTTSGELVPDDSFPAVGPYVVCALCARARLDASHRWTWLACALCREVDATAAARLGGRRLLPLGRHSITNGVMVPLAAPAPGAAAAGDQLMAMASGWRELDSWRVSVVHRLAEGLRLAGRVVPWSDWQQLLPPSAEVAVAAHRACLDAHHPDVAALLT